MKWAPLIAVAAWLLKVWRDEAAHQRAWQRERRDFEAFVDRMAER